MKRFILGVVLFSVGFLGIMILIASLICSPQSPWYINGVEGIYNGLVFMKMQIPVGACILTAVCGLVLAVIEAFKKQ